MLDNWQDKQAVRALGQKLFHNGYNKWSANMKEDLNACFLEELDNITKQHIKPWFDRELAAAEASYAKELEDALNKWAPAEEVKRAEFLKNIKLLNYDKTPDEVYFDEFSPEDCFKHDKDAVFARFNTKFDALWAIYVERQDIIWKIAITEDDE